MENFARFFVIGGIIMILIGVGAFIFAKLGIPFGQLPGDIKIEGENATFYFPIMSCLLISIILTIILNVIIRFLNK